MPQLHVHVPLVAMVTLQVHMYVTLVHGKQPLSVEGTKISLIIEMNFGDYQYLHDLAMHLNDKIGNPLLLFTFIV